MATKGCPFLTSNTSGSSTSTTLRHSGGIGSNGNMARSRRPLRRSSKRSPLRPMTSSLTCGACFKIRLKAGKRKASTPLSAAAIRKVRDKSAGSNTVGAESFSSRCNTSLMSGNNSRMRAVGTMRGPLLTKSSSAKNSRAADRARLMVAVEVPSSFPVSVRLIVLKSEERTRRIVLSG